MCVLCRTLDATTYPARPGQTGFPHLGISLAGTILAILSSTSTCGACRAGPAHLPTPYPYPCRTPHSGRRLPTSGWTPAPAPLPPVAPAYTRPSCPCLLPMSAHIPPRHIKPRPHPERGNSKAPALAFSPSGPLPTTILPPPFRHHCAQRSFNANPTAPNATTVQVCRGVPYSLTPVSLYFKSVKTAILTLFASSTESRHLTLTA